MSDEKRYSSINLPRFMTGNRKCYLFLEHFICTWPMMLIFSLLSFNKWTTVWDLLKYKLWSLLYPAILSRLSHSAFYVFTPHKFSMCWGYKSERDMVLYHQGVCIFKGNVFWILWWNVKLLYWFLKTSL